MVQPGVLNANYTATGLEHNEYGNPASTPFAHTKMSEKRWHKFDPLKASHEYALRFGNATARVGIICWGTTAGVCREALDAAKHEGLSLALLQLQMLWPLPVEAIREFIASVEIVLVPELNYQGQLAKLIQAELCTPVQSFPQYNSLPFAQADILRKVHEMLDVSEPVTN